MKFYDGLDDVKETMRRLGDTTPASSPAESRKLLEKAVNGDKAARDKLVRSNARFVFKIAKKFYTPSISLSELFDAGIAGLLSTIDKFDITKKNSFLTYARFAIEEEMKNAIKKESASLNSTFADLKNTRKIHAINKRLIDEGVFDNHERMAQIAYEVNLPIKEVRFLLKSTRIPLSYDAPMSSDDDDCPSLISGIADTKYLSPEEETINCSLKDVEEPFLEQLTEKQRTVINLRFGLDGQAPMSGPEIGKVLGCSKAWVGALERQAYENIKHNKHIEDLAAYIFN